MIPLLVTLLLLSLSTLLFCVWYYTRKLADQARKAQADLESFKEVMSKKEKTVLNASRATLRGQAAEQLVPLLPSFPGVPSDFRFLGSPVDFVGFLNMSKFRDTGEGEIEIVFVEVKYGKYARLSPVQKAIKTYILAGGKISWLEYDFEKENPHADTPNVEEGSEVPETSRSREE